MNSETRQVGTGRVTGEGSDADEVIDSSSGRLTSITDAGWSVICGLLLLIAVGAAYANSLHVPFIFDDIPQIKESNHVQILDQFSLRKLWRFWISRFRSGRPFAYFTFALNYCFGRYDPVGYHLVNIAVHVLAGLGVFQFTRLLIRECSTLTPESSLSFDGTVRTHLVATVTALLWALHPVQTESVTFIVQRMTALAGLFYFWGLYFYLKRVTAERAITRWAYFVLVLICLALGVGSKEIVATFPLALYLIDFVLMRDRQLLGEWNILHLLVILGFLSGAGIFFLGGWSEFLRKAQHWLSGDDLSYRHWSILERLMTEWRIVVRYMAIVLVPFPFMLNLDRNPDVSTGLLSPPTTLLALMLIVWLLVLAVRWRRTRPVVSFAILWFALHLVITSTVIPLELMYDHRLYLPLFGPVFMFTYLVGFRTGLTSGYTIGGGVLLVLLLATSTFARNEDWSSGVSIYRDVVSKTPNNPRGHLNLSARYLKKAKKALKRGDFNVARDLLRDALRHNRRVKQLIRSSDRDLTGSFEDGRFLIQTLLAEVYFFHGDAKEGFRRIDLALPNDEEHSDESRANVAIARAAHAAENYRASIRRNIRLLAIYGDMLEPLTLLARSFLELDHPKVALEIVRRARRKAPKHPEALRVEGEILRRMGRLDAARSALVRALALEPEDRLVRARTHESLAYYYHDRNGPMKKRREHARKALDLAADYVDRNKLRRWVPDGSPPEKKKQQ